MTATGETVMGHGGAADGVRRCPYVPANWPASRRRFLQGFGILLFFGGFVFLAWGCTRRPAPSGTPAVNSTPPGPESAGSWNCEECHEEEFRYWSYGGHSGVECEVCHGSGIDHVKEGEGEMVLGGNDRCMDCHGPGARSFGEGPSSIESFDAHLRTIEKHHLIRVKRAKERRSCVYCHDPHLSR